MFKKISLPSQIGIGLIAGIISGIILSSIGVNVDWIKPFGDIFIALIRMVGLPLVFSILVVGIVSITDIRKLGRIAFRTLCFFFITTALAVIVGLVVANIINPGSGLNLSLEGVHTKTQEAPSFAGILLGIIPMNPFDAFAKGNILQIIFFALIFGISLSMIGAKSKPVTDFINIISEAMIKMIYIVMRYAPIGVFALMVHTVSHHGLSVLLPLVKVMLTMYIGAIIMVLVVYYPIAKFITGISLKNLLKGLSEPLLVAFSTCSSVAAMASNMEAVQKMGAKKSVSSLAIPLGNALHMDGTAIYIGISAVFAAAIYGIPLPIDKQLTIMLISILASIGCMGVPGSGLIMIPMVFTQVGIPLEAVALIAGVDRVMAMACTSINILGDGVVALVVSKMESDESESTEKA